jgi:zinc D-Ala-D-Ala carboxypeptidase
MGVWISWTWRFTWTGYLKMGKWQYFQDSEVEGLQDEFIAKLEQARGLAGIPFVLTSTLRTLSENESIAGAVSDSSHLQGLAADIRAAESRQRFKIVKALLEAGITRLGIYNLHVHADIDATKDPNVIWVGESH